jgi:FixJ family two-component response regulator
MMPTMGGLEFRQHLSDAAPTVATILVTGQPGRIEELVKDDPDFQLGKISILYKPIHLVKLLAEVDKRMQQKTMRR